MPELLPVQPAEATLDRRTYIGGSDIAGILGLQPRGWRTAVEIWQRKTLPDAAVEPETPAAKRKVLARGTIVEPLIATMLAQLHGIDGVLVRNRRLKDVQVPVFAAEIDAEIPFPAVADLFAAAGAVSHYVSANIRATLPTQGELLALGAAPVPILDALALYPTPEGE